MIKDLLAIYGSPRKDGNTDILLSHFVKGAKEAGLNVDEVFLRNLNLSYCRECRACDKTGLCVIKDDMHLLYPKFSQTHAIVIAAPIFFYNVPALTKMMIDRVQCLWAKKYILKEKISNLEFERKGIFLSLGATKGEKLFEGTKLTIKYFFDAIDIKYFDDFFIRKVDNKGEINKYPDLLQVVYDKGLDILSN